MRSRFRTSRFTVAIVGVALVAAACGNSPSTTGSPTTTGAATGPTTTVSDADLQKNVKIDEVGVTDTEILVGGVAAKTNPLGGNYDQAFYGVEAYFDMVNEKGIYGRKIKVVKNRDDQLVNNQAEVKALISDDKVFAVVPTASLVFTGAEELVTNNVPTFGWNINPEYAGPPNLFGEKGSYLCFACATPIQPYVARQLGAKAVGILAYGISEQSKECAKGVEASFAKYPTAPVVFQDANVQFGTTDLSVQVQKMKDAKVDFVLTCMDTNGVTTLAKEMKKQSLDAAQFLENAYDAEFIANFGDLFQRSVVRVGTVPFESPTQPPGMKEYLARIQKAGGKVNEISLAGWMAANLFVDGLKAAGPEFNRQKVIDAINKMTNFTADGLGTGIDWTVQHTEQPKELCDALVVIQGTKYVQSFAEGGKNFVCFPNNVDKLPEKPTFK